MTPSPILLASPDLLGFHPTDSLVVIAFSGKGARGRLRVTTRWDLPIEAGALDRLMPLLRRERVTRAILAGFGAGSLVTPAVDEARRLFAQAGVAVTEALRAEGSRDWSYVCDRAECCPPEGRPYDAVAGYVAARATADGLVALPGRATLEGSVAPLGGAARAAMREATRLVAAEVRGRLTGASCSADAAQVFVTEALARVRRSVESFGGAGRLPDDEAARLGFDLAVIRVRDEAWTLMTDDTEDTHVALWTDLTRRLEPPFVPPAASLLGAAAWRRGDCVLAGIAVDRALALDASYSMAGLVAQGLRQMVSPAILRRRMPTPQELDARMGPACGEWLRPLLTLLDHHTALTT